MGKLFKLKPVFNKRNGQINFSLRKKELPSDIKKILGKDPSLLKMFKFKLEGFESG